jgi:hypothetical protein
MEQPKAMRASPRNPKKTLILPRSREAASRNPEAPRTISTKETGKMLNMSRGRDLRN